MSKIDITRPVHLIVNPHSGYGVGRHLLVHLRSSARKNGIKLIEYTTRAPQDATHYARSIADQAIATLVWGGDGTVSEVANGLAGSGVPILPCPVGTENLLATELQIPRNPDQIINILKTGDVVHCDEGIINGKSFMLVVGIGFDGEVVRRLTESRTGHISHLNYFWPIWRTFWEHKFPRMRIVADGQEIFDAPGLVFVGNIARYASGLRICSEAQFDDGLLDLIIFTCHSRAHLLCHATRAILRRHPSHRSVIHRRFKHVTIESETSVPCEVDGDMGPTTPLEISVAPKRIKLIVPQNYLAQRFRRRGDITE